ncbi:MAG: potassium transporter TrkA [Chloroflexi bacterium HGW-Chloroflexi-6]|nr:MAG: potassium transporter TrkA [Chloroflexi bacterium HGW-Chloroflexi-6]
MYVIIVGGGNTGSYLAKILLEGKHTVRVIESRQGLLEKLHIELPDEVVVHGDGSAPSVLDAAGIRQAHVLAAVTGDDETNLVITSLARFEFNVARTIGRVNNPKNAWLFTAEMGVDVALNQADILAHLVAEEMSLGDMMTLLKLSRGEYSLIEEKVHPDSVAVNKLLKELQLPQECTITAIIRKNKLVVPHGDTRLEVADEVLALVRRSSLHQFAALLAPQNPLGQRDQP